MQIIIYKIMVQVRPDIYSLCGSRGDKNVVFILGFTSLNSCGIKIYIRSKALVQQTAMRTTQAMVGHVYFAAVCIGQQIN